MASLETMRHVFQGKYISKEMNRVNPNMYHQIKPQMNVKHLLGGGDHKSRRLETSNRTEIGISP